MKKWCVRLGLLFVLLGVVLGLLAGCGARKLVFFGSVSGDLPQDAEVMQRYAYSYRGAEDLLEKSHVQVPMEDGTKLSGWLINRGATAPLVVMYGGNNMHVGGFLDVALGDRTRSYLLLNYRGYGSSEGEPSEPQVIADALYSLQWAKRRLGAPSRLAIVGFSLGSGVATQVAAAYPADALILMCPFDSILNVACDHVPLVPHLVVQDTFDSAAHASSVHCPVTIFAAQRDTIVSSERTACLRKAFGREVTYREFPSGHNDIMSAPLFMQALYEALPKP